MQPERRVCLLTGAGGRLGIDFCRRYRSRYHLVAVYRRRQPETATQDTLYLSPLRPHAELTQNHDPVFALQADLTKDDDLARVVDLTLARYDRVDLLINAAVHVRRERLTSIARSSTLLDNSFYLNAALPIRLAAILARRCWLWNRAENEARGCNIVNLSSLASTGLVPGVGLAAYSASKAALNMLTCHLAEELAPVGVRANVLAPTSFPSRIPTAAVSDAVVNLDESGLTGCIMRLDEMGAVVVQGIGYANHPVLQHEPLGSSATAGGVERWQQS